MATTQRIASALILLLLSFSMFAQIEKLLPVSIEGNQFVNSDGDELVFHGVNIRDPHSLENYGLWKKSHFQEAKSWGSELIRLPVHPAAWRARGETAYLELIDQAVEWAKSLEMYLIIDWHSIGNLPKEKFQHAMYETSIDETSAFWTSIAKRYANEPVVAMYELFNEPTVGGKFGELTWKEWKQVNEELIQTIRKYDSEKVILVAGFNWAYDLTPIKDHPVAGTNIAYVSHPYPEKRSQPWASQWQEDWGFVADKYPVILTEIGFALPHEKGVHVPVNGDETYGKALVEFSAERNISWVVWNFDSQWSPLMYTGDYEPTRQGTFFKKVMLKNQ